MTRKTVAQRRSVLEALVGELVNLTRNPIGLLETALQISAAKENGCDQGDCSCGDDDDCLAKGWEAFAVAALQRKLERAKQQLAKGGSINIGKRKAEKHKLLGSLTPKIRVTEQTHRKPKQPTKPQKPIL